MHAGYNKSIRKYVIEAIVKDEHRIFPCCVQLNGQYNLQDIYLGVPVKLGKNGIEQVIELDLNEAEMQLLNTSANHVKNVMEVFDGMAVA